jgi:LysM repeat protein
VTDTCNYNLLMRSIQVLAFSLIFFLLTSCTAQRTDSTPFPSTLIPFLTSTSVPLSPSGTFQPPEGVVAAETPLPSPTPFAYTIQQGDTISSIALEFGVSIDDLLAANPEVSPNAMSVGQVINIPSNPQNPSGEPTPTPASFSIQQIECYPTTDQGMWCFILVHNDFPDFLENLSAQITLVDANNAPLESQTALLPLNILPPNTSLPLTAFFSPPSGIPPEAKPQVQILTAIRLLPSDERYLPATISNTLVQVNADGRSARVNGQVSLPTDARAASQVWVTGTAYDEMGRVVGVRRWESGAGLTPGGNLPFEFIVSSLGGRIEQVEFAVEARP